MDGADPSEATRRRPVRTRALLWIFTIFIVVMIWLAQWQRYRFEAWEATRNAVEENRDRAILIEQYAVRTLESADIATLHIAERLVSDQGSIRGTPEQPRRIAGPIVENDAFLGLIVLDADGRVVAASRFDPTPADFSDLESFRFHRRSRTLGLHIGQPRHSALFGHDVIWVSRRLDRANGSLAAVVAVVLAPEQLIGFTEEIAVGPNDTISIIGLDGITRARRTGSRFTSGEDLRGQLVMRRQSADPNGNYFGPNSLTGEPSFFSHRRFRDYPLFATYGSPESDILDPARRRARILAVLGSFITAICVGLALALSALVSRRDRNAAELAEANRRLEAAQRVGRIGDWSYDIATGQIFWSPQMFAMYERDPALGPPTLAEYEAIQNTDTRLSTAEALEQLIATEQSQTYEIAVELPSGARHFQRIQAIPRLDETGRLVGIFGTDQDVTERRKLDQLESQVAHASRIEAMNAMASTLAHELNQPLTAASNYLVGTTRMMEREGEGDSMPADGVRAAREQVQFAGDIIRRVRAMVANEPRMFAAASLPDIVEDAVALATIGLNPVGLGLVRDIAPDARFVFADHVQIAQVLINLIRNAREAMEGGKDPLVVVRAKRQDDEFVLVSVKDNGPGFPSSETRLFDGLTSTRPSGLGLGLSISRTIVESHGGRIWVADRSGPGACVCFTLKAAEAPTENGSGQID